MVLDQMLYNATKYKTLDKLITEFQIKNIYKLFVYESTIKYLYLSTRWTIRIWEFIRNVKNIIELSDP